mmetsp:Transcript_141191/g.393483  ORF Transcript_141191/g.393483 Transcript_141191/m.393483 type:complete len:233 (+) Transcript_141191:47-745(+)
MQQHSTQRLGHDEYSIILLAAALNRRHVTAWSNWEGVLGHALRGACSAGVPRGATWQVRHVSQRRTAPKLPMLLAARTRWVDCQQSCHGAASRDHVLALRERDVRLLHYEAMLLQPPVLAVEHPLCWGQSSRRLQLPKVTHLHAPGSRVLTPESPGLRVAARHRARITQRCNELDLAPRKSAARQYHKEKQLFDRSGYHGEANGPGLVRNATDRQEAQVTPGLCFQSLSQAA